MYDLTILKRFIESPEDYRKYRNTISDEDITNEVRPLYRLLDDWYAENREPCSVGDLSNIAMAYGGHKLAAVLSTLHNLGGERTVTEALEAFRKKRLFEQIAIEAVEASDGRGSYATLSRLFEELGGVSRASQGYDFVTDEIDEILNVVVQKQGLRWRLNSLNRSLGSLRKGDFGFVFARPETGKTTFLASEVAHMAQQATGAILWLNNEEQGQKVKLRIAQAVLKKTLSQMLRDPKAAKQDYITKIGDRLKVYDSATITRQAAERMAEQVQPSLIVIDQIDKIQGFKEDRTDLEMGAIYQWARELSKGYCPVIGVCQADGTGEGQSWLTMSNVANAKTAKQAEADFIIGIGKSTVPGFEFHRYINISKNKLVGDSDTDPAFRHDKITCLIRPETATYDDL